jgi:hypothetical protein
VGKGIKSVRLINHPNRGLDKRQTYVIVDTSIDSHDIIQSVGLGGERGGIKEVIILGKSQTEKC